MKGDASNEESNEVKDTSFMKEKLTTPDQKRHPVPPPRRRLPVRQDDWCGTDDEIPSTPRVEQQQRLVLPHLEVVSLRPTF